MKGREIFKIWAPAGEKWIDWIRPVPFISLQEENHTSIYNFTIPKTIEIENTIKNTAIILDLPSHMGIEQGLALVKKGFRPIPIYNGTQAQEGAMAVVDNHLEEALVWGASLLQRMAIKKEALPVFLLDSNRTNQFKMQVSMFDNSWDIYPQDMPSATYFLQNGIDTILLISDSMQNDISKILYTYQQKGMTILFSKGYEEPKKVIIKKPLHKKWNRRK